MLYIVAYLTVYQSLHMLHIYSVSQNYKGTPIFNHISSLGGPEAMKFLP
jgi:hypothetical protein